jgi:hypothetical protein
MVENTTRIDESMSSFLHILIGFYDVHKEVWTGKSGEKVKYRLYHHPTHTYNIDCFVKV